MFKKTVEYTNFADERKTVDLYFHLNKTELMELISDGTPERINAVSASKDAMGIIREIKGLVDRSIGVRTEDGEGFDKSPETVEKLKVSAAYDELISNLLVDENAAGDFITNLAPKELRQKLAADLKIELNKTPDPLDEPKTVNHGSGHEHVLNGPAWIRENRPPNKAELRSIKPEHMKLAFAMRASQKVVEAQPAWLREKRAPTNEEYLAMDEAESLRVLQALQDGEIEL